MTVPSSLVVMVPETFRRIEGKHSLRPGAGGALTIAILVEQGEGLLEFSNLLFGKLISGVGHI